MLAIPIPLISRITYGFSPLGGTSNSTGPSFSLLRIGNISRTISMDIMA
jgi:hypothetical protein